MQNTKYQVVLPEFEGPLDLLLHLIDVHELDIYDIPISYITSQYMEYIRLAEEIDLNLSGEFLVVAGTLLIIKAKMLLPRRAPEEGEDEGGLDLKEEMEEKLLAYRVYQENARELKEMETSRTRIYFREVNEKQLLSLFPQQNPVEGLTASDLLGAFQEIMRLMTARGRVITVRKDVMSVNDKMGSLIETLSASSNEVRFAQLLEQCEDLLEAITTFLALLELLAKGLVTIRQTRAFGDIVIRKHPGKGVSQESEEEVRS